MQNNKVKHNVNSIENSIFRVEMQKKKNKKKKKSMISSKCSSFWLTTYFCIFGGQRYTKHYRSSNTNLTKTGINPCAPLGQVVPSPRVVAIVLLLSQFRC
jgi:hypothetical protein